MFYPRDPEIYDELLDVIPGNTTTNKGDAVIRQDVFGFYFKDSESTTEEVVLVYRMRQVLADKATGTGEAIVSGDKLYYVVATGLVTANPTGTAGTDYYFCGWAKKSATAAEDQVLMNFDGTRYTEA